MAHRRLLPLEWWGLGRDMDTRPDSLDDRYARALGQFLGQGGEDALREAYELGRTALAEGMGVVDMVALYHRTLAAALSAAGEAGEAERVIRAGGEFLVESLSPFEMVHCGFKEAMEALRGLNRKIEEEAKRIAHALHDEAGQLVASVHLALDEAATGLPSEHRPRLDRVKGLLDEIEAQLRRISHELRPTILDDLGLVPALSFLAEGVAARAKIAVSVEGSLPQRPPASVETAVYRIVQEALTNVVKHAEAGKAVVSLRCEGGRLRCSVEDDGKGFDPAAASGGGRRGLGLLGIRERVRELGGELVVRSRPGCGATLVADIPIEP